MKKTCIKVLTCTLIALCLVSVMATCVPVKAAQIEPYSYYNPSFSFKGRTSITNNVTGMFMDVTVRATASNNNNETITLEIYITNTGSTKRYTFLSDGKDHTYKNIYLGLSGGSNVRYTFTGANPEITINMNLLITS